jgi:hypothetical protein
MSEGASVRQVQVEGISHRLHNLIGLRAALDPFRSSIRILETSSQDAEARRRLLALWRPCQARLDLLLDSLLTDSVWDGRLRLLRQEMEDTLMDEVYSFQALTELTEALDQACEGVLLEIDRDVQGLVAQLDQVGAWE